MLGELIGSTCESTTLTSLNGHHIKLSSKFIFLYHTLVQLSDLIREVSLCRGQWLIQKSTTGPRAENKWLRSPQLQMGHIPPPQSPETRTAERWCLQDIAGLSPSWTYSNVVTYTRPAQVKPVTIQRCYGYLMISGEVKYDFFSLRMWLLIGWTQSIRWYHIAKYMDRTNWS